VGQVGWTVVGANDFNGDGVPDLVWQSDSTAQVLVWYMGGSGGATQQGWNWISSAGQPGWTAVVPAGAITTITQLTNCLSDSGLTSCNLVLPGGQITVKNVILVSSSNGSKTVSISGSTDPSNRTYLVRDQYLSDSIMHVANNAPVSIQNLTFCGGSVHHQGDPSNPCPPTPVQTTCESNQDAGTGTGYCNSDLFITNTAAAQSWAAGALTPFNNSGPYNVTVANCRF